MFELGVLNASTDVDVVRDMGTDWLRQVYNPAQGLVDIVPTGEEGYTLSWYRPNQVGAKLPPVWSAMGAEAKGAVCALTTYDGGWIAAGPFRLGSSPSTTYTGIARWNDAAGWQTVDGSVGGEVDTWADVNALAA